jgi:rare lipoprotein A
MTKPLLSTRIIGTAALVGSALCAAPAAAAPKAERASNSAAAATSTAERPGSTAKAAASKSAKPDRSARKQRGKASFYARKFAGRKMADGTPMNPRGNNAASKTLPLGTVARVTNLETGQSAAVTIRDRGPYVPGRIVDLSPATAEQIGLDREQGVAPVEVEPIEIPPPKGARGQSSTPR